MVVLKDKGKFKNIDYSYSGERLIQKYIYPFDYDVNVNIYNDELNLDEQFIKEFYYNYKKDSLLIVILNNGKNVDFVKEYMAFDSYYKLIILINNKGKQEIYNEDDYSISSCTKVEKNGYVGRELKLELNEKIDSKTIRTKVYETRDECVSDLDGVVINESKFSLLNESNVNLDESSEGTGLLTVIAQFIVDIINWLKNLF